MTLATTTNTTHGLTTTSPADFNVHCPGQATITRTAVSPMLEVLFKKKTHKKTRTISWLLSSECSIRGRGSRKGNGRFHQPDICKPCLRLVPRDPQLSLFPRLPTGLRAPRSLCYRWTAAGAVWSGCRCRCRSRPRRRLPDSHSPTFLLAPCLDHFTRAPYTLHCAAAARTTVRRREEPLKFACH